MELRYYISTLAAIVLTACATDGIAPTVEPDAAGQPVLFSTGSESRSRAVPYLGQDARFVCRMYYISSQTEDVFSATPVESWLKVNNAVGNSVYRSGTFGADEGNSELFDQYGFEKASRIFYWQNRKNHAFFAYTDLNRAFSADYVAGATRRDLCFEDPVEPYVLTETVGEESRQYNGRVHDMRTNARGLTSIGQQPDPAQALTVMYPSGSTQEANRVPLVFRHCLSQVVVNVKVGATSGITEALTADNITQIEMLGVSEEAYTYYELDLTNATYHAPTYKPIDLSQYGEAQLQDNPYGTAIDMFARDAADCPPGYLKSFHANAFGNLKALRIHWIEPDAERIEHITTFVVQDPAFVNLQSGTRYIFNIELRRGTVAVIRPEILPWEIDETVNTTSGFVQDPRIVGNEAELLKAIADGVDDITLNADIEISQPVVVPAGTNMRIDLNSRTITNAGTGAAINVKGNLTIEGNGTVSGGSGGDNVAVMVAQGAKCSIMSGTFGVGPDAGGLGNTCIYSTGGEVEIYGGYFSTDAAYNGFYYVLNQNNSNPGKITVYGGEFENYNPAVGDDNLKGNFVASSCKSVLASDNGTTKVWKVVPKDGTSATVSSASDFATAVSAGVETITLSGDIDLSTPIDIPQSTTTTIDLNGNTITNDTGNGAAITVHGNLTLEGNGKVQGGSGGDNVAVMVASDAKCTIKAGTYNVGPDASGDGNSCIYTVGGNLEIYGGTFSTDAAYKGFYYVLNQNNSNPGNITVFGGKFYNFNPATGDDNLKGNFVAPGYESVLVSDDGTTKIYQVRKKTT